jgi:sulfate adenylyltransferase subunit 2
MKTQALKQALDLYGFDAALGGARRDEEKVPRQGAHLLVSHCAEHRWDPKRSDRNCGALQHPQAQGREHPCLSVVELDRAGCLAVHLSGAQIPIVPLYFAAPRPVVERDGMLIMVDDERLPLLPGRSSDAKRVRFRTLGCYPLTGRLRVKPIRCRPSFKRCSDHHIGAAGPRHRSRSSRFDGEKEAGRILLMSHQSSLSQRTS